MQFYLQSNLDLVSGQLMKNYLSYLHVEKTRCKLVVPKSVHRFNLIHFGGVFLNNDNFKRMKDLRLVQLTGSDEEH